MRSFIIAHKEISSLLNEKSLILAMLIQLLIASFSSLLVIGLASFFDPSMLDKYHVEGNIGVVGNGELIQFIEKSIIPRYYQNLQKAMMDFNDNKIDAVLVIPPVKASDKDIIKLVLYLPKSDIKGTLVALQLKKPLEEFESYVREVRGKRIGFEPISLYYEIPKRTSSYFEFIYGILIPLLVFTPVFISGGFIIDTITEEYERKTLDLILVSPASFSEVLNGKILAGTVIVPVQVFLWLMLLRLNYAVHNIGVILLMISFIAIIIVLLGAIVALRYKERTTSQYIYSLILILLFLAGYLFANSPFNLVTRLSSGAIGNEVLVYCIAYGIIGFALYYIMRRSIHEYP